MSHPLKETMIGTNIFDLLKNIDAISKDVVNESGYISPTIRIAKTMVAGGK
ncbi:MAG: metallopeptidase TldD-related protein [Candidatus Heimdallarchaeota archaeon]